MNNGIAAALIRGFCINLSGKPQFVVFQENSGNEPPKNALITELDFSDTEDPVQMERFAAAIIRGSYENWKNSMPAQEGKTVIPSCAVLTANGSPDHINGAKAGAVFWIDSDYERAQKRLAEKDDSPVYIEKNEKNAINTAYPGAAGRSDVVKNKITLITGGAQGIGEEIARNIAAAGAFVFIADLNLEGAKKLADNINAGEKRTAAAALEVNVSSEDSVEKMINEIALTAGGLDLCISNAGVLKAGSVLEQELSDFKFVTDINYTGFFVISKFAGRLLRAQSFTASNWKTDVIQVNSKSGLEGSNKNGAYAGGKFGGIGLTASFAMELIEYGIKVNAVCPGNFLDGPLWSHPEKGLFVQYLRNGKVPGAKTIEDVRAFYESKVPMKRGCTGIDLVRAIFYLDEQEYETGQAVPVTGGQIMLH